jgi:F0F1-type ATP synthase membrane subunit b/b'
MEAIQKLLGQLEIDQSFFYQFAVFIVIFFLLKVVLFNKLLFVLVTRESKTTKLEETANKKFQEVEKLAKKYTDKIDEYNDEALVNINKKKSEVTGQNATQIKEEEKRINKNFEAEKAKITSQILEQKSAVISHADGLSADLIEKLC